MSANYESLRKVTDNKQPFITMDVETTGCYNGNKNIITQIALAKYEFNASANRYELQDEIFMLAKPDKDALQHILDRQKPTEENARLLAEEEICYTTVSKASQKLNQAKKTADKYKEEWDRRQNGESPTIKFKDETIKNKLDEHLAKFEEALKEFEKVKDEIDNNRDTFIANHKADIDEIAKNKLEELKNPTDDLKAVLEKQGITLDKYMSEDKGLTNAELQIGVKEFLKKYDNDTTIFMAQKFYSKHYLEKQNIDINGYDKVVDVTKMSKDWQNAWEFSNDTINSSYKAQTGKDLKNFDALTKSIALAEYISDIADKKLTHQSCHRLEEKVKETAFNHDDDYVMSLSSLCKHDWVISNQPLDLGGYTFNSLEYVNFGNDRRYVDLDSMFKVNDNFEITLEGEKTPIKTWEELEAKIKSLNAEISPELLENIHEKYNEIYKEADHDKKLKWETMYNAGTLTKDNMSNEQYQYLDSMFDIDREEDIYGEDTGDYAYTYEDEEEIIEEEQVSKTDSRLDALMQKYNDVEKQINKAEQTREEKMNKTVKITVEKIVSKVNELNSMQKDLPEYLGKKLEDRFADNGTFKIHLDNNDLITVYRDSLAINTKMPCYYVDFHNINKSLDYKIDKNILDILQELPKKLEDNFYETIEEAIKQREIKLEKLKDEIDTLDEFDDR